MHKKIPLLLLLLLLAACNKRPQKPACVPQICTAVFASINITFNDKDGNSATLSDFHVIDLRTNKIIKANAYDTTPGVYTVVDDSSLKLLSSDGDDLQVSATDSVTHQTKIVVIKVAGGCACHVTKISGPAIVAFD